MQLCSPTILYGAFSFAIVLSDTMRGLRHQALVRTGTSVVLAAGIEFLCRQGMTTLSWMIVFIPFIALSVITALILLALGIDAGDSVLPAHSAGQDGRRHGHHHRRRHSDRHHEFDVSTRRTHRRDADHSAGADELRIVGMEEVVEIEASGKDLFGRGERKPGAPPSHYRSSNSS